MIQGFFPNLLGGYIDLNINYRDTQKDLIKALFDLIEWELVKPIEDITKINRNTRIKLESVKYDNNFTKLLDSEIDKILYGDEDIRVKKTMLYVYTLIVSRIDDKRFCFPRRKTFKKDMQIKSNKRVQDAIDKLKELGLIDFAKAGIIRDAKGRIYNANNVYVTTYTENYSAILQNAVNSNREYHQENNSVVMQKKKREDTYSVAKEEDKTATVQVANGNNKVVDSDINVNVFEVFKQNGLNSIITQFISKNNISIEVMNNWLIDMENYFVSDEFLNMNNKKEMLKEILKTNIDVFEEEKINIEIDEKILNFDYENDYAQMTLKHVKKGLEGSLDKEHTLRLYENLKKCHEEEIEYREKVRATKEKRSLLKKSNNNIIELPV